RTVRRGLATGARYEEIRLICVPHSQANPSPSASRLLGSFTGPPKARKNFCAAAPFLKSLQFRRSDDEARDRGVTAVRPYNFDPKAALLACP
ncbi:MAG: hypothetical protein ABJV68_20160, partial [Paracoccaceae bacterium]